MNGLKDICINDSDLGDTLPRSVCGALNYSPECSETDYDGEVVILEDLRYKTDKVSHGWIVTPPKR